ncbi:MAG: hypothetical protein H6R14_1969 [Proteobacteria bacterium]|nr:hypothetical protein [Pseudomonadota bacterium]
MSEQKNKPAVAKAAPAKAAASNKPPKKLVPRPAPQAAAPAPASEPVATPPVMPVATAAAVAPAAKPRAARKPTAVEETVAKHQKVLADALVQAQAIKYDQPKVMKQPAKASAKPAKADKHDKPAKARKVKLIRDSYAMPENEYARIGELKKRMAALGAEAKKSELLRAGIAVLAALNDVELKAVMGRIERIKTGRPNKK